MDAELDYGRRMLAWADPSCGADDDPVCEWCEVVVPAGASAFAPYCSAECEREAALDDVLTEAAQPASLGGASG